MARRTTCQEHDRAGEIFRAAQAAVGNQLRQRFFAAHFRNKAWGHLGGEKAWCDAVAEDMSRAEFNGQIAGEVDHGGWGNESSLAVRFAWGRGYDGKGAEGLE